MTGPPEIRIAPSVLAADFARLAEEVARAESAGADWLHVDVMDGHFVPNLTIGPPVIACLRRTTRLPLDVHLMIENVPQYAESFAQAGANVLTFHVEALVPEADRIRAERGWTLADHEENRRAVARNGTDLCRCIRRLGMRPGVALNPATPASLAAALLPHADLVLAMTVWPGFGGQKFLQEVVPKVQILRGLRPDVEVQVDGGIDTTTARTVARAGANVLVAGTAVFRAPDVTQAVALLREAANGARNTPSRRRSDLAGDAPPK